MSFGLRHCGGIGGAGLVCVTAAKTGTGVTVFMKR